MSGIGLKNSLPEKIRDTFAVLRTSAEAGRLAHGYVISCAEAGWGQELSHLLLQWLFCQDAHRPCGHCRACLQVVAHTHPDVLWVEPESKSRIISIDQIRELNHVANQKSFEGGWKSAVILDAHRMTENAANAFLKTLEEPPPKSLFLLISDSPQKFLATILSRCQRVHMGTDADGATSSNVEQAMLEWLRKREPSTTAAGQSAWISAILDEVKERADKEENERATEDTDEDLLKARIQARVIETRLEILRVLYKWERDLLVCSYSDDKNNLHYPAEFDILKRQGGGWSVTEKLSRVERVEQATRLLDSNVPETAVWEAVLPV